MSEEGNAATSSPEKKKSASSPKKKSANVASATGADASTGANVLVGEPEVSLAERVRRKAQGFAGGL